MVCKALGLQATTKDTTELSEITNTVRDYTLGTALILGADPDRYQHDQGPKECVTGRPRRVA
jgi:hypothetical protein